MPQWYGQSSLRATALFPSEETKTDKDLRRGDLLRQSLVIFHP